MKKLTRMSLLGLLATGLLVSCGKEDNSFIPLEPELQEDYKETAFGINLDMVYVKGGGFKMGATAEQGDDALNREKPVRTVTLDSYHIGKYEVTQAQWEAVMGTNPSYFKGDDERPVESVSWNEAREFCRKLSEKTGKKYVLPTEAQWEYAARGGKKSKGYKYSGSNDVEEVAWYGGNSYSLGESHPDYGAHRVGTKKANELGIYDMSGNLWEWCSDWYASRYDEKDTDNPQGPVNGSDRVERGGSWTYYDRGCRVSVRGHAKSSYRGYHVGFRVACLP